MSTTADGLRNSRSHIKGIHHVGIAVNQLAEQIQFFANATTIAKVHERSFSGAGLAVRAPQATAVLEAPNVYVELMEFAGTPKAVPVEGPGFTHICFQSPAPLAMYHKFTGANATAVSRGNGPVDLGGYGVHYAYLRDRNQIMYEVEQLDRPQFSGDVWVAHVALVSADIDRLIEFYSKLFDIEPYRRVNKVTGPRVDDVTGLDDARARAGWFNVANMILEIWEYINPPTPGNAVDRPFEQTGYNKFAFEVSDIEAEVKRLNDLGVEWLSDVQATPLGKEIYAADPDGNRFSLVEVKDPALSLDQLRSITWQTV
jgi:catechol 2,3-dioxygenase-like lactoylglutathione lyase family enzyme